MNEDYKYASNNNYDYFCTVMTITQQKNSLILNTIGLKLSSEYPNTKYFFSDFKKNNGNLIGNQIAESFNLYKQDYCGCIYSYNQRQLHRRMFEENFNTDKNQ